VSGKSAYAPGKSERGTIPIELATVLGQEPWPGQQYVLALKSPRCAALASPGQFVHLRCGDSLPMRRPFSLQRADASTGTLEILYKVTGEGTRELARRRPGEQLSCLGPIGHGFVPALKHPRALLIGGGVGIPPLVFLAERLAASGSAARMFACFGSELPFPFRSRPSTLIVPGLPPGTIGSHPLLESLGAASRLASLADRPGAYLGFVTELARHWLAALDAPTRAEVAIYACGPTAMLRATAALAREFRVPAQVSLEENMACAVGGCAGCTVEVETPAGPAMRRVCVDGPVFDAATVFRGLA
jgi:dihydroorotate dehydrogenase electron transfer subunit